jgi:hypothetical protein
LFADDCGVKSIPNGNLAVLSFIGVVICSTLIFGAAICDSNGAGEIEDISPLVRIEFGEISRGAAGIELAADPLLEARFIEPSKQLVEWPV